MTPTPQEIEKARELVDKVLPKPDWIYSKDWEDCFVCGTPLSPEKYAERSKYIVEAIALALHEARIEAIEEAASIVEDKHRLICNCHEKTKDCPRVQAISQAIRAMKEGSDGA